MAEKIGLRHESLTSAIIAAAIRVHRELGPGLLESAYEACLAYELATEGVPFRRQAELPVRYRDTHVDAGYRIDFVVDEAVVLELKAIESLAPIHEAQLLTYLRLSGYPVGLLMNFNVSRPRDGIVRRILTPNLVSPPCPPRPPR